jgi:hypothetical protein
MRLVPFSIHLRDGRRSSSDDRLSARGRKKSDKDKELSKRAPSFSFRRSARDLLRPDNDPRRRDSHATKGWLLSRANTRTSGGRASNATLKAATDSPGGTNRDRPLVLRLASATLPLTSEGTAHQIKGEMTWRMKIEPNSEEKRAAAKGLGLDVEGGGRSFRYFTIEIRERTCVAVLRRLLDQFRRPRNRSPSRSEKRGRYISLE